MDEKQEDVIEFSDEEWEALKSVFVERDLAQAEVEILKEKIAHIWKFRPMLEACLKIAMSRKWTAKRMRQVARDAQKNTLDALNAGNSN